MSLFRFLLIARIATPSDGILWRSASRNIAENHQLCDALEIG
jgi:hypothetical protein